MGKFIGWLVLGVALVFLFQTFNQHWQEVATIELESSHLIYGAIALLVTLIAHIWSGIVWAGILRFLQQPAPLRWVLPVYLQTNLAKYIPGNMWHFYGRIRAIQKTGANLDRATLVTLLEPLLMATAAVLIAIVTTQETIPITQENPIYQVFPFLFAGTALMGIHPRFLNPLLSLAGRLKKKKISESFSRITDYPWLPLLGEIGFVVLRGSGFIIVVAGLKPLQMEELPLLLGGFSMAWFFGLVIPSPGGIGVFESSAIALLSPSFPVAILLSSLALFRLISISAEVIAAALSWGIKLVINH